MSSWGSLVLSFFQGLGVVRKDYIPENCGQSGPKGGWGLARAEGKSAMEGHDCGETMEDLQPIVEKSPF